MKDNSVFKNDASMSGQLPRVCLSCYERGKVGLAHWRSGKKKHTSRLRRRILDKIVIAESLGDVID
jgi:hypothetical protein